MARGDAEESPVSDESVACVLTADVLAALNRVVSPATLRSLELWSTVAEAARRKGILSYSGTVPTESLWAHLRNVLGLRTQTIVREDLWEAMSSFVFQRFIFQRASKGTLPQLARKDPLIAEAFLHLQGVFR